MCDFFTATWIKAFDTVDIALIYATVVEVLQTGHTENVTTKKQSMADATFLRLQADTTIECLVLELFSFALEVVIEQHKLQITRKLELVVTIICQAKRLLCLLLHVVDECVDDLISTAIFP